MIYLQRDTENQTIYLSLVERWKDFGQPNYYKIVFNGLQSTDTYEFIANVTGQNERFTVVTIDTTEDEPLSGNVILNGDGEYEYIVYGISDNDLSLTGQIFERGLLKIQGETYTDAPIIEQPIIVNYE
jgi:hypothetical protein